ncbi:MAG TPA: PleD family two-component system response regulator [Gammaproteobacteria bacterium]|nr:PleD family two-component system response regulator [Gammaproteobacteria bacterium]
MDASSRAKPRILIVDDVPVNCRLLLESLKGDYKIDIATSGEQALLMVTKNPPDLILLDIMMPRMDGYEVCERLKQDSTSQDIPIIFLTAKNSKEDEARGFEWGVVDYISKPFHIPVVKARIRTHLQLKRRCDLLNRLASVDALTGIPNRRHFTDAFEVEWRRAIRGGSSISVMLIDVDYFKQYNDTYGHSAGDECLKRIARSLQASLNRPGDSAARIGGEEFAVLLPETDALGAAMLAERIRSGVEELGIPHEGSAQFDVVTVSAGVATVTPSDHMERNTLLNAADEMLYQAKEKGRNQVIGREL